MKRRTTLEVEKLPLIEKNHQFQGKNEKVAFMLLFLKYSKTLGCE